MIKGIIFHFTHNSIAENNSLSATALSPFLSINEAFPALMKNIASLCVVVLLLVFGSSCSRSLFVGELSDYEEDIQTLQGRLVNNPSDAAALRDLGAIYLNARQFAEGNTYLERAFAINPDDAKTLFNLGLANETLAKRETALRLYEKYVTVPRTSPYRRLMEGRYEWLTQRMLKDQMKQLAEQEPLDTATTSPRIVAVFPFIYHGADDKYAPLARGLAELVSVDLANVSAIRVVERVRLQSLLDELALSESQYMDEATAPRIGKMLGAGRLVSGGYNVVGKNNLRLDGAYTALETSSFFPLNEQSDALRNLFVMQKAFVFNLINELGVELSPDERSKIEFIPTENLQAFIAYSRGLREEDAGAYGLAAGFYRRASQLDEGFSEASLRAETAEAMAEADKSLEEMIAEASEADAPSASGLDLMGIRIGILNNAIGSGFVPGEDAREPASESGGGAVLLRDPPIPPNPNN